MTLDAEFAAVPARRARDRVAALKKAIDSRLEALAPPLVGSNPLGQAVRYALVAPGKRIRPLLAVLTAEEFETDPLRALDAGCALEMVHAASLVLDDLPTMDNSPLRRGRPSTHVVFGEDTAVLAAVTLLSQAYGTVANAAGLDCDTRCVLVAILARAVGADGLAGGQFQDLRMRERTGLKRIAEANHLKTGMLFVAAVEMAGAVAAAHPEALSGKQAFATHLGQAFQILDDLNDVDDAGPDGAAPGSDEGKTTVLSVLGRHQARRRLERHLELGLGFVEPGGVLAGFVSRLFVPA